jgi:hypothetical protein
LGLETRHSRDLILVRGNVPDLWLRPAGRRTNP